MIRRPWGVHDIRDIYHPRVSTGMSDGRWVASVAIPYPGNRLVAAWWVLTGRAYAFVWPKAGDIEQALGLAARTRVAEDVTKQFKMSENQIK